MPALTRRASKCIIRWLPNETLAEIIQYLDAYRDLRALCMTSRLINALATPFLYRNLTLTTASMVSGCFLTLRDSSKAKAGFVRELSIASAGEGNDDAHLTLPPSVIDVIITVSQELCQLQYLELFVYPAIAPLLHSAHFPTLRRFTSSVAPEYSAALQAFINRHQTLTCLELFRTLGDNPTDPATSVPNLSLRLPNLLHYCGPGSLAAALVADIDADADTEELETVTVTWYADDPMEEPALASLGRARATPILAVVAFCDGLSEAALLRCTAQHIPRIAILQLHKISTPATRFSAHEAHEIAQILTQFPELCVLKFLDFERDDARDSVQSLETEVETDRSIVRAWGNACRALVYIGLHGRAWTWKRTEKSSRVSGERSGWQWQLSE
ncbi:hypothetical protein B0H11DRAFT_2255765 [Mycena galericulata]|nr:hypothetical protein B0H11DRAFT_2255765 [Mycena galericulata]